MLTPSQTQSHRCVAAGVAGALPRQIHNHLLSFADIKRQGLTPPPYRLTCHSRWSSQRRGVVSKLNYGVVLMRGSAVIGEEYVEQGPQHTELRTASVHVHDQCV